MSSGPHIQQLKQVEELRTCVADLTNANQQLQCRVDGLRQANRRLKDSLDADRAEADAVIKQLTVEFDSRQQANPSPLFAQNAGDRPPNEVACDMAKRTQAEGARHENALCFEGLLQSLDVVVWSATGDGRILFLNRAVERVFGRKGAEFLDNPNLWREVVYPEDRKLVDEASSKLVEHGQVTVEYRIVRPDGELRWLYDSKTLAFDRDGNPGRMGGIAIDITQRKQTEQELRTSYGLARAVIEGTTEAIFVKDPDGRHLMVNSACARILGKSAEEIIGKDNTQLFPLEVAHDIFAADRQAMASTEVITCEESVTPHGSDCAHTFLSIKFAHRDSEGNVIGLIGIARDITDRQQAEAELTALTETLEQRVAERTEEVFQQVRRTEQILQTMTDGYILANTDGALMDVNPAYCDMVGYSRQELLSMNIRDLEANFDVRQVEQRIAEMVQSGRDRFDTKHKHKDGRLVDLDVSMVIMQPKDKPVVAAFVRDVTEQKQAEEELRQSETRFRMLAETAPASIFIWRGTRFCSVNPAMETMTGYSTEELLGMGFWDVIHPDCREFVKERGLARLHGELVPQRYETKLLTKDGEERWVDLTASLTEFEGEPAVLGAVFDITDRKRAEEERARLALIIEETTDFVSFAKPDGRVEFMNKAMRKVLGISENYVHAVISDVHAEWSRRLMISEGLPTAMRDGVWRGETGWLTWDGREIPISQVVHAHKSASGEVELISTIGRDISDRKKAERAFEQLAHVSRVSTMGEMAAALAHELNQPLGSIAGNAQACLRGLRGGKLDMNEVLEALDEITSESLRAGEILHGIGRFVSKTAPNREAVDVNEQIREAIRLLGPEIRRRVAQIHLDLEGGLQPITGDAVQIQQVLVNVIRNSLEAVDENQPADRRVIIRTSHENDDILISVSDTGSGFSDGPLHEIFEPYFTTKTDGLGMGLSISRTIVNGHGGRLRATCNTGRGMTFAITLPSIQGGRLDEV